MSSKYNYDESKVKEESLKLIFAAGGLKEKNILKNRIKQENTLEIPNTEEIITTLRSDESLED